MKKNIIGHSYHSSQGRVFIGNSMGPPPMMVEVVKSEEKSEFSRILITSEAEGRASSR